MDDVVSNARVLVTGGAGFIGSNLIDTLMKQGNEVVCLDNFFSGKRENVAHHLGNARFKLKEGDIRNLATCHEACEGVDYVLHQAAVGSVPRSIDNPILSTEVNIMGFLNMLVASRDAKVRRFVFAASSSTYGDSVELPKIEDRIGRPLSPYAITKYADELYARVFSDLYGLETIGLRYFNVYGRRQDPFGAYAAVIPRFAMAMVKGDSPVINGDGEYSRDFTYIDNIIQINQLAALTDNPDALGTVFNAACGERTTLNGLVSVLREHMSRFDESIAEIQPEYGPSRAGDIPHSLASIGKAKSLLGYNPQFDFSSGIAAAAEWYFRNLKSSE